MGSLPSKTSAPTKGPAPTELLTPQDFAKATKVSLSWLAKARKRGDGPRYLRFGRSIRYFTPHLTN